MIVTDANRSIFEVYEDKLCTVPWAVARNGQVVARFMSWRHARDYAFAKAKW